VASIADPTAFKRRTGRQNRHPTPRQHTELGSVLSVASVDSSCPGIIGYAPRAAGCSAVDHPGKGITQPKTYEEGQQGLSEACCRTASVPCR
jgi:hypothetical protein